MKLTQDSHMTGQVCKYVLTSLPSFLNSFTCSLFIYFNCIGKIYHTPNRLNEDWIYLRWMYTKKIYNFYLYFPVMLDKTLCSVYPVYPIARPNTEWNKSVCFFAERKNIEQIFIIYLDYK